MSVNTKKDSFLIPPPKDGETRIVKISTIKTGEPFQSAARFDLVRMLEIYNLMLSNGFDPNESLVIDLNTGLLVDGHHRLQAAIKAGLTEIPVTFRMFKTKKDALTYIASRLKTTRNFDEKEKYCFIVNLFTNNTCLEAIGCVSREMDVKRGAVINYAKACLGLHKSTITKYLTVLEGASEEQKQAIESGKLTLNKVYNQVSNPKSKSEIKTRYKAQLKKETVFVTDTKGQNEEWFVNINSKMHYHKIGKRVYAKTKREVFNVVKKNLEGIQKKGRRAGKTKEREDEGRV